MTLESAGEIAMDAVDHLQAAADGANPRDGVNLRDLEDEVIRLCEEGELPEDAPDLPPRADARRDEVHDRQLVARNAHQVVPRNANHVVRAPQDEFQWGRDVQRGRGEGRGRGRQVGVQWGRDVQRGRGRGEGRGGRGRGHQGRRGYRGRGHRGGQQDRCWRHHHRNCGPCNAGLPLHVRINNIITRISEMIEEVTGLRPTPNQVRGLINSSNF